MLSFKHKFGHVPAHLVQPGQGVYVSDVVGPDGVVSPNVVTVTGVEDKGYGVEVRAGSVVVLHRPNALVAVRG